MEKVADAVAETSWSLVCAVMPMITTGVMPMMMMGLVVVFGMV